MEYMLGSNDNVKKRIVEFLNEHSYQKTNLIDVCTGTENYSESNDTSNSNCNNGVKSHMVLKIKSNHKFTGQNKAQHNVKSKVISPTRVLIAQHYKQSNSMSLPLCKFDLNKNKRNHNCYSFKVYQYNDRNGVLGEVGKMVTQKSYSVSKDKVVDMSKVNKREVYSRNGLNIYKHKRNTMTFSIVDIPFNGKNEGIIKERMFCGKYLKASHMKGRNIINLKMKNVNGFHEVGKCLGNTMKNAKSLPQIKFKFEKGFEN